jgi:RNA polymerase primary sigma factor
MGNAPAGQGAADLAVVRALFAGKAGAWEAFVHRVKDDVYTACRLVCPRDEVDQAFNDIFVQLHADNFARLAKYDGRAKLSSYLRLELRDLLAQRLVQRFVRDRNAGWPVFEAFFKPDITRLIARYFPPAVADGHDDDRYHDIVALLVEDDCRRIRAYDGHGSFGGFVLGTVRNLCIDLLRKEVPRRRLPATIARLPELEQAVFRQLYWSDCPPGELAARLARKTMLKGGAEAVARAVEAVKAALPPTYRADRETEGQRPRLVPLSAGGDGADDGVEIADERDSPEAYMLAREEDESLEQATHALRSVIATLPLDIRLYVQLTMSHEPPLPPREIARRMARPVAEIYRLKQQAERALERALSQNAAVRKWLNVRPSSDDQDHAARSG